MNLRTTAFDGDCSDAMMEPTVYEYHHPIEGVGEDVERFEDQDHQSMFWLVSMHVMSCIDVDASDIPSIGSS